MPQGSIGLGSPAFEGIPQIPVRFAQLQGIVPPGNELFANTSDALLAAITGIEVIPTSDYGINAVVGITNGYEGPNFAEFAPVFEYAGLVLNAVGFQTQWRGLYLVYPGENIQANIANVTVDVTVTGFYVPYWNPVP